MKQESIPVGCVPPNFLILGRSLYRGPPDRDPQTKTPLDRDPFDRDPLTETPMTESPPPRQRPPGQRPSDRDPPKEHGTRDRDHPRRNMGPSSQTGSDIIQRPPPPVNRMIDTHLLTLPQTLFAVINILTVALYSIKIAIIN